MERWINHTGILVSDLEQSAEFYLEVTDGEIIHSEENYAPSGYAPATEFGDPPYSMCLIKTGSDTMLELIACRDPPEESDLAPMPSPMHVAFELDDVQKYYKNHKNTQEFDTKPYGSMGPNADSDLPEVTVAYLRDPDNHQVELIEVN